jgi:hypothetical protein
LSREDSPARIGHINRAVNLAIRAAHRQGPLVWNSPLQCSPEEPGYAPLLEFEQDGVRQFVSASPNVAGMPRASAAAFAEQAR